VGGPGRVAGSGGANSILPFQLERRGDVIKYYRKRRQRARLGTMRRKRGTT
jgi:hypothetical protein